MHPEASSFSPPCPQSRPDAIERQTSERIGNRLPFTAARLTDVLAAYRDSLVALVAGGELTVSGLVDTVLASDTIREAFAASASLVQPHRTGDFLILPGGPPLPRFEMSWKAESVWPPAASHNPWTAFSNELWDILNRSVRDIIRSRDWTDDDQFGRDVTVFIDSEGRVRAAVCG